MKKLRNLAAGLLILLAIACNSDSEKESMIGSLGLNSPAFVANAPAPGTFAFSDAVSGEVQKDNLSPEPIENPIPSDKKKIIKDGNISIRTEDIAASKKNIDALLKKFNSYYDTEELQNNDRSTSYSLTIRIPANHFEAVIATIENGKDEIISKSIHSRDVTEEYVDTESRLNNKREYLKRYKDLLAKASTVKDILEIEENIRVLQEEIESKEGRLKYLNDQVAFSTLDISLYQEKEYVYKPPVQDPFLERIKDSLNNGWTGMVDFAVGFIGGWPVILLFIGAFFLMRRIIRNRRKKRMSSYTETMKDVN